MSDLRKFDIDLRRGQGREAAFVEVMLRTLVEHKRDWECEKTGNVAVELKQKHHVTGDESPSGVNATDATRWAVEFFTDCWIILPTEYVKELARRAPKFRWGGDGGLCFNALVPVERFVDHKYFKPKPEVEPSPPLMVRRGQWEPAE